MGVAFEGHDGGDLTLVFTVSALRELADPPGALEEAREWSQYVAVVDRNAVVVESVVEEYDLDPDIDLGDDDKWQTMERLRTTTPTPRHVFVGVTDGDRTLAMHLDWEFLPVAEAAQEAGWELEHGASDDDGLLARLVAALPFGGA